MQYIPVKDIKPIIKTYKDASIPFLLRNTTFTQKLITKHKLYHYVPVSDMLNCESTLIKNVKMFADKIPVEKLPKVDKLKISYIKPGKQTPELFTDEVFEIDLNRAFWEFCYRENTLSKKIYYQGINKDENGKDIQPLFNSDGEIINHVRKKSRLIALGNCAKVETDLKFDGHFFARPIPKPARNENIFFNVAQLTDYAMKSLQMIAGDNFLFYWCDAVFFKGEKTKDLICDFLVNQLDFEFKTIELISVDVKLDQIVVLDKLHLWKIEDFINKKCTKEQVNTPRPRPFIFRSYQVTDLSNLVEFRPKKFNLKFLK